MVLDITVVAAYIIVIFIFYLLLSIIIRDVGEYIFRIEDNSFHKSIEVSTSITALFIALSLAQSLFSIHWIILIILNLGIIYVLYLLVRRIYRLTSKTALLYTLTILAVYIFILLIVGFIVFFFQ